MGQFFFFYHCTCRQFMHSEIEFFLANKAELYRFSRINCSSYWKLRKNKNIVAWKFWIIISGFSFYLIFRCSFLKLLWKAKGKKVWCAHSLLRLHLCWKFVPINFVSHLALCKLIFFIEAAVFSLSYSFLPPYDFRSQFSFS